MSVGVTISGSVGPVTGDIVGGDKIIQGATAEELVAALEARGFVRRAKKAGLERQTIIKLAQRLNPDDRLDFDQAVRELERAVTIALEVIATGERGTNHDAFVNDVLARVAVQTRAGDFEGGKRSIEQGLAELDAAHRRSKVALLDEGIKVDILRRDPVAVARQIAMLVEVDEPTGRPAWLPTFRNQFDEYLEDGETKGINFSLEIAIELARRMLAVAEVSTERGTAGNLLGIALARFGEREGATVRLEAAVAAYQAALVEWKREQEPLQWAATQNNLGIALLSLGERESGTARLIEAVGAIRAALTKWTQKRVPLEWAAAQNNLGNALMALGLREGSAARLKEAVVAYHAALIERTRERMPLEWAATQNNLGKALWGLGDKETGTERLKEAVATLHAALTERTRARVPLKWAMTQNNLGIALLTLGERESGTARLAEAVNAFRAALSEYTRERVPLEWAATQSYLGVALMSLGECESGTARLQEAVVAYRAALTERTRERVPLDWAATQNNLGVALWTLGERERETARLEEALRMIRSAWEVFQAAGFEHYRNNFEGRIRYREAVIAMLSSINDPVAKSQFNAFPSGMGGGV